MRLQFLRTANPEKAGTMKRPGRAWLYSDWDGKRLLLGCDEYDRMTLLVRLWGTRAVVFALWRDR